MKPEASVAVKAIADEARALFLAEQADTAMALVSNALQDHDHPRLKRMQARLLTFFGDEAAAGAIMRDIIPYIWEPGFWELAIAGSKQGYAVAAPEHKLLYFPVRKCGCTSLYNMMRGLNGKPPAGEDVHADQKHELVTFETLRNDYAGWHTLLVVRDPIERVRSYYHGNIIGRDHLVVDTGGRESFYGLSTNPDYETFIKNLDAYRRTFIVVRNHTDPITAFAGTDPSLYDTITTLNGLQDALSALSEKLGTPLSVSHDMKTTGHASPRQPALDDAALSDFYAQDYESFGRFLGAV